MLLSYVSIFVFNTGITQDVQDKARPRQETESEPTGASVDAFEDGKSYQVMK